MSPFRSNVSQNSQAGRLDRGSGGQRHSKAELSSRGIIRIKSTLVIWFSSWLGRRLDCVNSALRCSRERWETALGSQETYLKTGKVVSDRRGLDQPNCQEEWKKCNREEE